jgi:hypothetical protein
MANMQCCGVNNYTDFREARLFVESSRNEGLGKMVRYQRSVKMLSMLLLSYKVPESCCILQGDRSLCQPADEDCISAPTTANSYLYKVSTRE